MKPFRKVLAFLLTAVLLLSTASCTPISLTKEWSYKYNDDVLSTQLDIGVYIYGMYQAYNQAQSYASEVEGYVEGEPFTDLKITDDEGTTAVAKDWIKTQAEKIATTVIATDYLVAKNDVTVDEATLKEYKSYAQDTWDMGPYASQGYYNPMKAQLEPFGVSFDSFYTATYETEAKQNAVFQRYYGKDGIEEVSDKELEKYFNKDYVAYSYVPVDLYSSTTDESGNASTEPYGKKETNKIVKSLEDYADQINDGSLKATKAFDKVVKDNSLADTAVSKDIVELFTNTEENNADIAKALKDLDNNKATVIKVGTDGTTPQAYLIVKHDTKDYVKDYIKNDTNRPNVLTNYKREDFTEFVNKTAKELLESDAMTVNTAQLDRYTVDLFYVKPEETTAA